MSDLRHAVIVAAVRSPIGRAFKGSLVGLRPDDMSARVILRPPGPGPSGPGGDIDDIIWGGGQGMAMLVERLS